MTCPACHGPITPDQEPGRLGICRWCGVVLVTAGAGNVCLVTDEDLRHLRPQVLERIAGMQKALRTIGAARRN